MGVINLRLSSRFLTTALALSALLATALPGTAAAETAVRQDTLNAGQAAGKLTQTKAARLSPSGTSGRLLFEGNQIDDFLNQSAPGAVREVSDPTGSGAKTLRMTVADSDVAPITPTDDPRAQLVSPSFIEPGDEFWWHFSFYLPNDFPERVPGWLLVGEGPYGFPWNGSPPVSVGIGNGEEMGWQRNGTYDYDVPWSQSFERGKWTDVLMHIRFAGEGFVETWIDGEQVTFFGPDSYNPNDEPETTRLQMATRDESNDGGKNFIVLQNYREAGMFGSATVYHGPTKVGTTRASVEG
jgi:polysaccharide lyase-like protein